MNSISRDMSITNDMHLNLNYGSLVKGIFHPKPKLITHAHQDLAEQRSWKMK